MDEPVGNGPGPCINCLAYIIQVFLNSLLLKKSHKKGGIRYLFYGIFLQSRNSVAILRWVLVVTVQLRIQCNRRFISATLNSPGDGVANKQQVTFTSQL